LWFLVSKKQPQGTTMGTGAFFGAFFTGKIRAFHFFMNLVLDPLLTAGER
jgi:hypothetical protein